MAETSRSQVTITLGRSGQVVKRGGPALDSNSFDSCAAAGSKRSVRDRLGSDVDQVNSKRQRGNIAANVGDARDMQLGKGDLRFKLMQKNVQKGVRVDGLHNGLDLRDRLSRAVRPSMTTSGIRQRMPEPNDTRQRVPELKDAPILGRIPSVRSADALPQLDSLRNAYSPWTLDQLRRGSPDRSLRTSRGFSPQRNEEDLPKRRVMRTYDDVRTIPYMSKDILEPSRSMGSAPFLTKSTVPDGSVKSVPALRAPPLPSSSIAPKTSYMVVCKLADHVAKANSNPKFWCQQQLSSASVQLLTDIVSNMPKGDGHLTVDGLLHSLGLEKYAIYFKAEEVDMAALRQMGDNDLKELGIPMGPRKKILLALHPPSKRPFG